MEKFTKKDLRDGDIIECRDGLLGIVLNEKFIIYNGGGFSCIKYDINNDLTSDDGEDCDIIRVYRYTDEYCKDVKCLDFYSYQEDGELIFEADGALSVSDAKSTQNIQEDGESVFEDNGSLSVSDAKSTQNIQENKRNIITIMAQGFYGNRTITTVAEDDVDMFLLGHMNKDFFEEASEQIDRTIVHLPNSDNVVVLYNKYEEEKRLSEIKKYSEKHGYIAKPLCSIPEMNIDIYSRCFLCRIDENGLLQSILPEDCDLVKNYFAF